MCEFSHRTQLYFLAIINSVLVIKEGESYKQIKNSRISDEYYFVLIQTVFFSTAYPSFKIAPAKRLKLCVYLRKSQCVVKIH